MSLLTNEVRAWIGREVTYVGREELGRAAFRYFALAVGDENRLYTDEAYAREAGFPSVVAPSTFVCETNQYVHRPPDDDGYIGHVWRLPVQGCRLIRAGHEYEFVRPVLPTDRVRVTWRLEEIIERISSTGGPLLFVVSTATYTDQNRALLARNRETIVYEPLDVR
jgi:acyl dehydratase